MNPVACLKLCCVGSLNSRESGLENPQHLWKFFVWQKLLIAWIYNSTTMILIPFLTEHHFNEYNCLYYLTVNISCLLFLKGMFATSCICNLCVLPKRKAYDKQEGSSSCFARCHSVVVVICGHAQMPEVPHDGMMLSSSNGFLMLMCHENVGRLFTSPKSRVSSLLNASLESSLKSLSVRLQCKVQVANSSPHLCHNLTPKIWAFCQVFYIVCLTDCLWTDIVTKHLR